MLSGTYQKTASKGILVWASHPHPECRELSKNVAIDFKPCAVDNNSFNYVLNKPITKEMYEFFKYFGY